MKQRRLTARMILERARKGRYAIGAFNVGTFEVFKAIMQAANRLRAPVIIETSPGETAHLGASIQAAMVRAAAEETRNPLFLNLDHATTPESVQEAIEAGYAMVHFDGSTLPPAKNARILQRIVPLAHRRGILVEGELDHITGSSEWHRRTTSRTAQRQGSYTNPDAALRFVQQTGIDIFAAFFGNVHGVFRDQERLDLPLLKTLATRLACLLSLHGGSGIRDADVRKAIALGIVKINVNTELRMAYAAALKRALKRHPREIVPYRLFAEVIPAVQKVVERKIRLFGSAGKR